MNDEARVYPTECIVEAWAQVFCAAMGAKSGVLAPTVVTIKRGSASQNSEAISVLTELEATLNRNGLTSSSSTSMTIFPWRAWRRKGLPNCVDFSSYCVNRLYPRMKRLDSKNRYGTYFTRMMDYPRNSTASGGGVNQLAHVCNLLKTTEKAFRTTALQISILDPLRDHTRQPVRGFPCLQQIGLRMNDAKSFEMHAFYPTQYILDRAYGNYLGLMQLGEFLEHESSKRFKRLVVFAGKPKLSGKVTKSELVDLNVKCLKLLNREG